VLDCFVDNIVLTYDNATKKTFNQDGVDVVIRGFGATETVEFLDDRKFSVTGYFGVLADVLVKRLNYTRGVNIRGAPYDWRKSPNEYDVFYKNLTRLVEETFELNNQTKVMLVAHSMGNLVTLYWLNNFVNQEWKDKYIKNFVSLSAPWGKNLIFLFYLVF
jgi:lysophospholipase-3